MTNNEILDAHVEFDDVDVKSIRGYFKFLLSMLWDDSEAFSGKRPFGNGGWECDVYRALIQVKAIKGVLDVDDSIVEIDYKKANKLVFKLIESL